MSESLHRDEFEEQLKRQAENYELKPPAEAWDNIHRQLPKRRRYREALLLAAMLLIMFGAAYYLFFRNHTNLTGKHNMAKSEKPSAKHNKQQPSQQTDVTATQPTVRPGAQQKSNHQQSVNKPQPNNGAAGYTANNKAFADNINPANNNINNSYLSLSRLYTLSDNDINNLDYSQYPIQYLPQAAIAFNSQPAVEWPPADSSINKPLADAKKSGLKWNFAVTPSVGYRSLKYSATSAQAYFNVSANANTNKPPTDLQHHPAAVFAAKATIELPLSKKFSLQSGLGVKKEGYNITAQKSEPTFIASGAAGTNNRSAANNYMSMAAMRVDTFTRKNSLYMAATSRNFDASQAQKISNEYYYAAVPVYLSYQAGKANNTHLRISTGVDMDYLFYNKVNIFSPVYNRYFKSSELIRKWNADYVVSASMVFPMQHYALEVGPDFHYQLLSPYKNYTVKEHLYSAGIKIGLTLSE